jgi:hypothetical protein
MTHAWMEQYHELDRILNVEGGGVGKTTRAESLKEKMHTLGWNKSFIAKNLSGLDDEMIDNAHESHIISGFSSAWLKRYGHGPSNSISSTLQKVGIHKKLASHVEYVLSPLIGTSYSYVHLFTIAIEYIQGIYAPLTATNTLFYINEHVTLTWFKLMTNKNKVICAMNIPHKCSVKIEKLVHNITQKITHTEPIKSTYYFHATSWKWFNSICNKIYNGRGHGCLDFGIMPGFYLSKKVSDCLEWGEKKSRLFSDEIAIFVFSIPDILPSTLKFKALRGEEWSRITSLSRRCATPYSEIDDIEDYDFMYGDMVSNPADVMNGYPPRTHNPPKKQLVSKSTNADTYLQSRIVGCYFFRKQ